MVLVVWEGTDLTIIEIKTDSTSLLKITEQTQLTT